METMTRSVLQSHMTRLFTCYSCKIAAGSSFEFTCFTISLELSVKRIVIVRHLPYFAENPLSWVHFFSFKQNSMIFLSQYRGKTIGLYSLLLLQ